MSLPGASAWDPCAGPITADTSVSHAVLRNGNQSAETAIQSNAGCFQRSSSINASMRTVKLIMVLRSSEIALCDTSSRFQQSALLQPPAQLTRVDYRCTFARDIRQYCSSAAGSGSSVPAGTTLGAGEGVDRAAWPMPRDRRAMHGVMSCCGGRRRRSESGATAECSRSTLQQKGRAVRMRNSLGRSHTHI